MLFYFDRKFNKFIFLEHNMLYTYTRASTFDRHEDIFLL